MKPTALSNDTRIARAIDWMTLLTSGRATPADREAFSRWENADPANAAAWASLKEAIDLPFASAAQVAQRRAGTAHAMRVALELPDRSAARRRQLLKGGVAFLVIGGGGYAWHAMQDDFHTALAERRTFTLPDDSRLTLNARSSIKLHFSEHQRHVALHKGELVVQVARDTVRPARPFIVSTEHGTVQALGTRFLVTRMDGQTRVAVLEHSVLVTAKDGRQRTLQEGEAALLRADGIESLAENADIYAAWTRGLIDVRNTPLAEVIEALRPYHPGWIRVSPEAGRLPVFGVFPLDRSQDVLRALSETLPIRSRSFGPWLTLIDTRAEDEN